MFKELEKNCKVIFDGDAFAYFKADDIQKFLKERQADFAKSESGKYINVEFRIPVECVNVSANVDYDPYDSSYGVRDLELECDDYSDWEVLDYCEETADELVIAQYKRGD